MIKHRNARGWRQAAKPWLGKETRSREPKILLRDAGYHSSSSTALFHRPSVTGWRILPPNQPPGALGCHQFPRRRFFSNTPYSAPALQLVNAPALDLQIKRAYKWFTNHPNDLTGFVMSMDSSGTSVLMTFRSAGKQKWQFSQFLPSKSQSLQSMTARFQSCQEVLPSLTCKFIWGRIHDTVLQERFFFFLIHTLTLRKMGKQAAGNQLPTKLQGFTGAMKQNIFNAGLQALFGCMDLPRFCTSSPFTPQGSPRPPQFQQHH